MTYIYALIDPRTKAVRYIGKTTDLRRRLSAHNNVTRATYHTLCWLKQLYELGLKPQIRVLQVVPKAEDWAARERYWIKEYRKQGVDLTNISEGGEGAPGVRQSAETIAKRLASIRANPNARCFIKGKGREQWPSEIARRKARPRKSSPEWKAKIAKSLQERFENLPPEEQSRIRANGRKGGGYWTGKKRGPMPPEARQNIAAGMRRHFGGVNVP